MWQGGLLTGWGERYFSFMRLTTVGYGNTTLAGAGMRGATALEAFPGRIFLAVLVAHLIGMHIDRRTSADHTHDGDGGNHG